VRDVADITAELVEKICMTLRQKIEDYLLELGEERVHQMVAEGWSITKWSTMENGIITFYARLTPPDEKNV